MLSRDRLNLVKVLVKAKRVNSQKSITELEKKFGLRRKLVVDFLKELEESKLIVKQKENRKAMWMLSNKGIEVLGRF